MSKADLIEIKKHYSEGGVVKEYNRIRFGGIGGRYINDNEISPNITLLKSTFKNPSKIKVLDIGAGRGRLSHPVKKLGFDVYCLDSSKEMVKVLRKVISRKNIFIQSAFERIKSQDKFNVVTAMRFFDHFKLSDQKKILLNVKKNISKNGYVLFSALNAQGMESLVSSLFYFGKVNFYYPHSDYEKMFKDCGFKVVAREDKFFFPRGVFLRLQNISFLVKPVIFLDILLSKVFKSSCSYFVYLLQIK